MLDSATRDAFDALKISCITAGIRITPDAYKILSGGGKEDLSIHEYPTTGGVTFELNYGVFVNAPFDEWYSDQPEAELDYTAGRFRVLFAKEAYPVVRVLPLPGYLETKDHLGRPATDTAMSHADRIRLSPFIGCAYDCGFCDLPAARYEGRSSEQVLAALEIAKNDERLPPRHVLISGGSPRRAHYELYEEVCTATVTGAGMPVDIMMSPMLNGEGFLDRIIAAGVAGFAINIEVFSEASSVLHLGRKYKVTRGIFADFAGYAASQMESGAVRSLIIPGLEPIRETLAGVEALSELGIDPVLSPFRPAEGTALSRHPIPSQEDLATILRESREIVQHHNVVLGPRCIPCQHNTLTLPWDVEDPDG